MCLVRCKVQCLRSFQQLCCSALISLEAYHHAVKHTHSHTPTCQHHVWHQKQIPCRNLETSRLTVKWKTASAPQETKARKKKKKKPTKSECNSPKSCGDEHCQLFMRKQQREPNMWSLNMLLHASSGLFQVSDSLGCCAGHSVLFVMSLSSCCSTSTEHD